jgi:starch phosphorylase
VQILFAGKAHPQDMPAKEIIKAVIHATQDARIRHHLVFLEDYDINVARYLVQGVDVWMNNPRRPMEASGTSGMKAAANGALNLSILDGWWCEGYANAPDSGWAIGSGETYADPEEQDRIEGQALYNILEQEVVPLYYDRDKGGMPRRWIDMMRASIQKLGAFFNTHRMLTEYLDHAYLPAHRAGSRLATGNLDGARRLGEWRARVAGQWQDVNVRVDRQQAAQTLVGGSMELTLRASLGGLSPDEVSVEVLYGPLDPGGEIRDGRIATAALAGSEGAEHVYRVELPASVTGMHGYAARVMPRHADLASRIIPDLITWED